MDANDWRAHLHYSSRQRIVDKIFDTIKRHLPVSHPEDLVDLKEIAARFEENMHTACTSQSDYLRRISLKMLTFEANARSLRPSSSSSSGNPSVAEVAEVFQSSSLPTNRKRKGNLLESESVKKKLSVVEYGDFLERSGGVQEDEESLCPVCLCSLNKNDEIRDLLNCSHVFHKGCLDMWIDRGRLTCPCCRSDL